MASQVQKLQSLYSLGQSILVQLYNARNFINDPKIRPEIANVNNSKLAKALIARFPESATPDKVCFFNFSINGGYCFYKAYTINCLYPPL